MPCWWRPAACRVICRPRSTPTDKGVYARLSGCAQLLEELIDLTADAARHRTEIVGHRLDARGVGAGCRGCLVDPLDLAGGLAGALRRDLHAARDLLRGGALLGDRGGDRA